MDTNPYYTRQTLAEACGLSVRRIDEHTRQNTLRIGDARIKVPGIGILFHVNKAARFVAAMQAKHGIPN